jgi:hypothetical protein
MYSTKNDKKIDIDFFIKKSNFYFKIIFLRERFTKMVDNEIHKEHLRLLQQLLNRS